MKRNILVVDDELPVRKLFTRILAEANFGCIVAESVSVARTVMIENEIDLLITDLRMPEESGQQFITELQQTHPNLPVIVVSGIDSPVAAESTLALGVYGYIIKPFSKSMVLITIANAFRRHALEALEKGHRLQLESELQTIMDNVPFGLLLVTPQLETIECNRQMIDWFLPEGEDVNKSTDINTILANVEETERKKCNVVNIFAEKQVIKCQLRLTTTLGPRDFILTTSPVYNQEGTVSRAIVMFEDLSDKLALEQELRQAQKLEAVGQLAAGIAHEINTPVQFIGDNLQFLSDAFDDFTKVFVAYDTLFKEMQANGSIGTDQLKQIEAVKEEADLDYLLEEVANTIEQSQEGTSRIGKIVKAMKEVSHPGNDEKVLININHALESTMTVSRNEWKYVAEMETNFSEDLPLTACLPNEMNQVFLNMIINAAHAIDDRIKAGVYQKGVITLSTRSVAGGIEIIIADNGAGIPQTIQEKVFEPFFTTKAIGKGTGQGLSIAHSIIVQKHGGKISLVSKADKGTTFTILLPSTPSENNGSA